MAESKLHRLAALADGIHGSDARWYRWATSPKEVRDKLGVTNNPSRRIVNYPTSRHDGRVGAPTTSRTLHIAWATSPTSSATF